MKRRESWAHAKSQCQHYRRRSPEKGALYQLVYDKRQDLEYRWEELFQPEYGYLRPEVIKAYDAYLNCGVLEHGAARVYCDGCQHTLLVAFIAVAIIFVVVNCIRLRSISPKHLEFKRATAGYSSPIFVASRQDFLRML